MKIPDGSERTQEEGSVFASETLKDLNLSTEERGILVEAQTDMVKSRLVGLARTALKDDAFTLKHSERLAQLSMALAIREGLGRSALNLLGGAAMLHDMGKRDMQELIYAPRRLTSEEMQRVREHPDISAKLAKTYGADDATVQIVRGHHSLENDPYPADFELYPSREMNKALHELLLWRMGILAVADQYDSMRSERPYRGIMPRAEALNEIQNNYNYTGPGAPLDSLIELTSKQ